MEQNNFEKNVQQKMDELKIAPSESVWTNVEKRIGKKQKDRKLIFIIFFLIVILLSGSDWLLNSSKNDQKKNQQVSNVIKIGSNSKATNNQDSSLLRSKITTGNDYRKSDSASGTTGNKIYFKNKIEKDNQQKQMKLVKGSEFKLKENYSKQTNNEASEIALNDVSNLHVVNADMTEIGTGNFVEKIEDNDQKKIKNDRFLIQLKTEKTIEILINNGPAVKNNSAEKRIKLWNFGIIFSGGSSLLGNNILEKNYSMADITSGFPSGGIPSYYYSPSSLRNSTAIIAGIFIEKNISPKTKISLGISYKYFSLMNKVGNKIDSLFMPAQYSSFPNNVYSSSSSFSLHSYRNNFHYLGLPVTINFQLNKNSKLPLSWNAGINISQLVSSNALQFQSNPGLYYNDNSMFNKTQFGVSTGLSFTIFSQQKVPFTFGPHFSYNASSLADKGLYGKKHFIFIGIRTEILFHKK